MPPDGTMSKKSQNSFFFLFPKCISEWGFDWGNDSHMLMDDHELVLIRNTDMGCYQDGGLILCVCVCVCEREREMYVWVENNLEEVKG